MRTPIQHDAQIARAVVYARYSSDLQRSASIDDQLRNCRRRAEAEGWVVTAEYADRAISGSDATRPEYRAMLEAATIRRLEFQGVRIIATSDGYDSESKARKVHRGFKGLMNEIFLDDLREKTHRGLTGQALKGFWTGGAPMAIAGSPSSTPRAWTSTASRRRSDRS